MEKVVGIGVCLVSDDEEDVFKIFGLGSCIGLVMHCPNSGVLGVAHFLLPCSNVRQDLAKISPAYFVDTGVDALIHTMCNDYRCKIQSLAASFYGGAEAGRENDIFHIGSRNIAAVKKKLDEYHIGITDSDTGGKYSRTLTARVKDGMVDLKTMENIVL